ncbi:MAG: hypothetical protein ACK4RK_14275 [Gemmataceae bacterium]
MEFRWIMFLTLWTMLSGPVLADLPVVVQQLVQGIGIPSPSPAVPSANSLTQR